MECPSEKLVFAFAGKKRPISAVSAPRKAPLALRGSRPASNPAPLRLDVLCTEADFRAALEQVSDAAAPLLIPIEDWTASAQNLFSAFLEHPLYEIPVQNLRTARRFALAALRRIEDIEAWAETLAVLAGDGAAHDAVTAQLNYGNKRLAIRHRKTGPARLRAAWAAVECYEAAAAFAQPGPDASVAAAADAAAGAAFDDPDGGAADAYGFPCPPSAAAQGEGI